MRTLRKKIVLGVVVALLVGTAFKVGAFAAFNGLYSIVDYVPGDITDIQLYQYNFTFDRWDFVDDQGWQFHSTSGTRWFGWEDISGFYGATAIYYSPDGVNVLFDSYAYSNSIVCQDCG